MIENLDWNWIELNAKADCNRLRMAFHGDKQKQLEICQIDCRQRTITKLADTLKENPHFIFATTLVAQQSTSDAIANFHASLVPERYSILDMTGGLAIDDLHFAKKAKHVVMCDIIPELVHYAQINARAIGAVNIECICCDSVEYLKNLADNCFDCIFIDPARRDDSGNRLYALSQCIPDVTAIIDDMLRVAPLVIIKASPMIDITQAISQLNGTVDEAIAVGTTDECKELILICRRNKNFPAPRISSVTIANEFKAEFSLEETMNCSNSKRMYDSPISGGYIYEPYPSAVKIAVGCELCSIYKVNKIAQNTQLYCSDLCVDDFPGKKYKVIETIPYNKKCAKEIAKKFPEADITCKNFYLKASELQKILHTKPSGVIRIFAVKNSFDKPILVVATS